MYWSTKDMLASLRDALKHAIIYYEKCARVCASPAGAPVFFARASCVIRAEDKTALSPPPPDVCDYNVPNRIP